jgi:hypothetical protein
MLPLRTVASRMAAPRSARDVDAQRRAPNEPLSCE